MERIAACMVVLVACGSACSCEYIDSINHRAHAEYHSSRWTEVVESCVNFTAYEEPAEPLTPRVCEPGIRAGYPDVVNSYSILDRDWDSLVYQTGETVVFLAEMLNVLDSRDTLRIEQLAPQIESYVQQQAELETGWRESRQDLKDRLAELEQQWEVVWPDSGLNFDLAGGIAAATTDRIPSAGTPRHAALVHYHQNEYARLARDYLAYDPGELTVNSESHIPQGCENLAYSLRDMEAGLLVRYSLDVAAQKNAETISQLARVDLSQTPWEEITVPRGHYGDRRVPAAVARLKLLKYLDEILTGALDVLVREVRVQWDEVWPGSGLETNIFAFTGLDPAPPSAEGAGASLEQTD